MRLRNKILACSLSCIESAFIFEVQLARKGPMRSMRFCALWVQGLAIETTSDSIAGLKNDFHEEKRYLCLLWSATWACSTMCSVYTVYIGADLHKVQTGSTVAAFYYVLRVLCVVVYFPHHVEEQLYGLRDSDIGYAASVTSFAESTVVDDHRMSLKSKGDEE